MCNLDKVLPHTADATSTDNREKQLLGGVHFFCGDIFDAVTMVKKINFLLFFQIYLFLTIANVFFNVGPVYPHLYV